MSIERRRRKHEVIHTSERAAADIIKAITPITSTGHRPDDIFEDWLILTEATLDMLPAHLKSAVSKGQFAEDTPKIAETWAKMRDKYDEKRWVFERFSEAFRLLLIAAYPDDNKPTYRDIVGETFMQWGRPSASAGQFFTPWTVAKMMAEMVTDKGEEVHTRLKAAVAQSPLAEALFAAGLILEGDEANKWLLTRVIPAAIEHYKPVTVIDPAVGSGILLLAHAETMLCWMVARGLIQYYGYDINMTCVRMARINCKLYGLNGHHLSYALDLTPEELAALPKQFADKYTEAQQAQAVGSAERVEDIAREVRGYQQMGLYSNEPGDLGQH